MDYSDYDIAPPSNMSIELRSLRTVGDYGSSVKGISIPDTDHDTQPRTQPNIDTDRLPTWTPPETGVINEGFENSGYDLHHPPNDEAIQPTNHNGGMELGNSKVPGLSNPDQVNITIDPNWSLRGSEDASKTNLNEDAPTDLPEEAVEEDQGCWSRNVTKAQGASSKFFAEYGPTVRHVIYGLMMAGYAAYFAWSLNYEFGSESSVRLLWMTMLVVALIIITLIRDNVGDVIYEKVLMPPANFIKKHFKIFKWCFISAVIAGLVIFLVVDVALNRPKNLISLSGFIIYVIILFLFSKNPAKVRWRPVLWGLGLQFVFGLLVLRTSFGYDAFKWLGDRVQEFMLYSDEGAIFIFGENFMDHFFAFKVLPIVIFFSSIISVLYYLGTMQTIIGKIAWVMQRTLGTTAAESVNAAGNIFIGQTEAPLLIRPMIHDMTKSELHAVMVGGYATIAGSVMATYISIGVAANHLISASIMAAPCALAMSKLFYPETEVSKTTADAVGKMEKSPQRNIIEAASAGASGAIGLVANIAVNLMAFISLLAFVNTTLTWMGHRAGMWPPDYPELTFELICSYALWPFAFIMGTDPSDCRKVAQLIGTKTFINEFVAYSQLSVIIDNSVVLENYEIFNGTAPEYINEDIYLPSWNQTLVGGIMTHRSQTISTYALCGFANIGSLGTVMGALGNMAPDRKSEISVLALRAMVAGTIVSFMNACTAGLLYQPSIS